MLPGLASCAAAFLVVYLCTPPLIGYLQGRGLVVRDANKRGRVMVARPGGISLILGLVSAEAVLYAFLQSGEILAVMATGTLAFLVGYVDDRKGAYSAGLGRLRRLAIRWLKPAALAAAALPILLLGAHGSDLEFPPFGRVHIPVLYVGVVVFMVVVTGNTVNSIDVLNGVASGFMAIAGFSLGASLFILQNYEMALASLTLGFASLAFYRYHKLPSRVFPGDSGALALGAMYGAIAIAGRVEVVAAVALLPAILNSFLFLSSVKRIVEHRQIRDRPVELTPDMKLRATGAARAPVTLVRLILAPGPMTEGQVAGAILRLAAFSGALAVATAAMMAVSA